MKDYTVEDLRLAVEQSQSIAEVLRRLGLVAAGGNYQTVKKKAGEAGISTSHFSGQGYLRGKENIHAPKRPLDEILVEDSTYTNTDWLRRRLLKEGVFEHKCSCCLRTEWQGQPIPLELDHKNGKRTDNRKCNLRLVCPNCHALTPTYRGKNIRRADAIRQTSLT